MHGMSAASLKLHKAMRDSFLKFRRLTPTERAVLRAAWEGRKAPCFLARQRNARGG